MAECKWHDDTVPVIFEVQEADKKGCVDSEQCSLRKLLQEMEDEGWTDVTVNSHDLTRPSAEGPDVYRIKPKPLQMHYFWSQPSATFGLKYTSIASIFQENALNAARPLSRIWRVGFLKEAK
ncbi:unnamed protein product, partial [Durusdinium trenchii]